VIRASKNGDGGSTRKLMNSLERKKKIMKGKVRGRMGDAVNAT
jgi:hypothetical protein